jgi:Fe-S-cluster containining protein
MLEFDKTDSLFVGDKILNDFWSCTDCGICCNYFEDLFLYENELIEIAKVLEITSKEFKRLYTNELNTKTDDNGLCSLNSPCPFIKNKKCTIYPHRFFVCRTFPFFMNLTKNQAVLSGIYLCPQATQFYEGLLEFYKQKSRNFYEELIAHENHIILDKKGMKIQAKVTLFSSYLDFLFSKNNINDGEKEYE